jgi:protein-S-isoprenylcysteine O-methyltransferase Ste14
MEFGRACATEDDAMDTFRYWLAVVLVCTLLPFLLYWPVLHGYIGFWRRRGLGVTLAVVLGGCLAGALAVYRVRQHLFLVDYGTNWALVALGILVLAAAVVLRLRINRVFPSKTLLGLPELAPDRYPQELVRSGIYARVRHPRYAQFVMALGGYALIANYLAVYIVWLLWLPGIYVVSLFEERELKARFGDEYERYLREVPRFVPRLEATESEINKS